MIINNIMYGIVILPIDCPPYEDGYRFGAYKRNLRNKDGMRNRDGMSIIELFKTFEEVKLFVRNNKKYGYGVMHMPAYRYKAIWEPTNLKEVKK